MGLKGYRLWVMGQIDSNVQSPAAADSWGSIASSGNGGGGDLPPLPPLCSAAGCV
jgi:hypothetical protein